MMNGLSRLRIADHFALDKIIVVREPPIFRQYDGYC